ncbi:SRPBCC domain-containing protein [Dyadobacter sp. NIV53]|uniref:SRPBCC family protein n=1 Tax=Dyadobacter sp. NIV53 TaxID=2861765 RepID=UPI001C88B56D|nr:SRPBCC domain-containing protein [Dyadobacter sp. NIV53]
MNNPLVKDFTYNVAIIKVWEALTSTDKMKEWYFPQLRGFEPVIGFKFEFDDDNAGYQKEWIVTKVVEGQTLAHSWAYKGYPGSSEVLFDLFSDNSTTTLRITQTDLESFPNHPHFQRERFESGWDNLLGQNLKQLLEKNWIWQAKHL